LVGSLATPVAHGTEQDLTLKFRLFPVRVSGSIATCRAGQVTTTTSSVVTLPPCSGTPANGNITQSGTHPRFVFLPTHQTLARFSINGGGYSAWRSVG
jgi:hypothetical protein